LSRDQGRPAIAGYLAKAALGEQDGPGNLVSGREKACVADHARGVNWPFHSPRRRSAASPPSFDKLGMLQPVDAGGFQAAARLALW
jgi:hypothetical protein